MPVRSQRHLREFYGVDSAGESDNNDTIPAGFSLSMNFAEGDYSGAAVANLTVTRAAPATTYAVTASGVLTPFAANIPRITDRGLLIEESRVNLALRSQEFDNGIYVSNGVTITANAINAPDGTATADKIVETAAGGEHQRYQSVTLTAAAYSVSCYLKAGERTQVFLACDVSGQGKGAAFNLANGTIISTTAPYTSSIQALANGWYRCTIHLTGTAVAYFPAVKGYKGGTTSYTGTAGEGFYAWGLQVELGAAHTSYIPTAASSVTRNSDVVTLPAASFAPLFNPLAGTLYGEWIPLASNSGGASTRRVADANDGTANNRHALGYAPSNQGRYILTSANVAQADIFVGTVTPLAVNKIAAAWTNVSTGNAQLCTNGTLGTQDTTVTPPSFASPQVRMCFGADNAGTSTAFLNGYLKRVAVWKTRLANSELQSMTAAS